MTCCFTGHRPQNLPFGFNENDNRCKLLKDKLKTEILHQIEKGTTHFITGMALGTDIFAAEIIVDIANRNKNIHLSAYIPYRNQTERWSFSQKLRYRHILKHCKNVVVLQESYNYDCMQRRNHAMVDNSDIVIAVWDGSPSGTGSTVKYARYRGKEVILINPKTDI